MAGWSSVLDPPSPSACFIFFGVASSQVDALCQKRYLAEGEGGSSTKGLSTKASKGYALDCRVDQSRSSRKRAKRGVSLVCHSQLTHLQHQGRIPCLPLGRAKKCLSLADASSFVLAYAPRDATMRCQRVARPRCSNSWAAACSFSSSTTAQTRRSSQRATAARSASDSSVKSRR